jgi:hypothetical protein
MQTSNLLTLLTRLFAGFLLTIISAVYVIRGEYVPAVLFGLIAALFIALALSLLHKIRGDAHTAPPPSPEEKP